MAELTERQWQVYEGIRSHRTPQQIAKDMRVTPQYVAQLRGELRDLGVIRQRGDLPTHGRYEEVYPWELIGDQPPAYKPALPPEARLRLEYPQDAQRDLTVPPIRHVRDDRWSVQGIPMARQDGKAPKDALPTHRVVVVTDLEAGTWRAFLAPVRVRWTESETAFHLQRMRLTREARRAITLMIAAAIGVESVFDLSTDKELNQ